MYTYENLKTKKALKEAVKAGRQVKVFQPGMFGPEVKDGTGVIEGPQYPEPHKWYAQVTIEDGMIVGKVK